MTSPVGKKKKVINRIAHHSRFLVFKHYSMLFMLVVDLQMLNAIGLAPARYEFEDKEGPFMTDFIIMERIDGVNLVDYIAAAKEMRGLDKHDMETWLRIPGLRVSEKLELLANACLL